MDKIKVSLDKESCWAKPTNDEAAIINKRIGGSVRELNSIQDLKMLVSSVGSGMHTFCGPTFKDGKHDRAHFEQQQIFALDFDNKDPKNTVSFEQVKARAALYDLPIFFAYDTCSSVNHNRFRVVFLNDNPIEDIRVSDLMLKGLATIFPEVDPYSKNPTQMYFGGENVIYTGLTRNSCPTISAESVVRNTVNFLENKYGAKHYKPHVTKFYRDAGISLDEKGNPDISIVEDLAECSGASLGDNLQNPIIYTRIGRKSPKLYRINFGGRGTRNLSDHKKPNYHRPYDLSVLGEVQKVCRLFREFISGEQRLHHMELFGIATNMVQIQKGESKFKEILRAQSYYDNQPQKYSKWEQDLRRIKGYKPCCCSEFCPYRDTCPHGKNILSTAKIKYHQIEQIANYENNLVSLGEAWHDFSEKFRDAVASNEPGWHVIKSQTALGKTQALLEFLRDTPLRVLIAVPTNNLKREICERAKKMGIDIIASPSLHEIKDDIPSVVWDEIQALYDTGKSPMPRIKEAIAEDDMECAGVFKQYIHGLSEFSSARGYAITTHRRLTSMDLSKYDLIIVDEDIIYSTVITNRETVSISMLRKLRKQLAASNPLAAKIKRILREIKESEFFTLDAIDWREEYADIKMAVNISALCSATYFCYRAVSDQENDLTEDSITFIKPVEFPDNKKYIMLSATVDENICKLYFGEENVRFYNCKEAAITGSLHQYGDKAMGRSSIRKGPSIIKHIKEWTGFNYTVSFKEFHRYYEGELHFGNCVGCDILKGKNIDVIGTPHQPEWIYKLFAYSLGYDVGDSLKPNTVVIHNGFRFRFMTYTDEILRAIQFYMIESELEQAVGRARLLRCDCTVNLFSDFPLKQAELSKSAYDTDESRELT